MIVDISLINKHNTLLLQTFHSLGSCQQLWLGGQVEMGGGAWNILENLGGHKNWEGSQGAGQFFLKYILTQKCIIIMARQWIGSVKFLCVWGGLWQFSKHSREVVKKFIIKEHFNPPPTPSINVDNSLSALLMQMPVRYIQLEFYVNICQCV